MDGAAEFFTWLARRACEKHIDAAATAIDMKTDRDSR